MTTYTDRAGAMKAALQDVARDIEADLGKLARYRGSHPNTDAPWFRDPGPDVATFEKQKGDTPGRVQRTVNSYGAALSQARDMIPNGAANSEERALRSELIDLVDSIRQITNHADAADLVGTFEN